MTRNRWSFWSRLGASVSALLLASPAARAAPTADDEGPPPGAALGLADEPTPESESAGALRDELLGEVRREVQKTRDELIEQLDVLGADADARNADAESLQELRRTVNLLQLHGYLRGRGELLRSADLGRSRDPGGSTLFPSAPDDTLGMANLRLRLNGELRVSDTLSIGSQIDVLNNAVAGSAPLVDALLGSGGAPGLFTDRTTTGAVDVQRVWAQVGTPFGQLSFGRMGFHFGEGMIYNDGNCPDCDYGTTFDRLQLAVGPVLGGHTLTVAADALSEGSLSSGNEDLRVNGNYGQPFDLGQLDDAWRASLQVTRRGSAAESRRQMAAGRWVLDYDLLGAFRSQSFMANGSTALRIGGQLVELGGWAQLRSNGWRLAAEAHTVFGRIDDLPRLGNDDTLSLSGQRIDVWQGGGLVRVQRGLLAQEALQLGLDLGVASGDSAPGMGARPGRKGSGADGNTASGDIDGRQFACTAAACTDRSINNLRWNPDFRIDQLLWRSLFTRVTDAWVARAEVRYKPGGRPTAGAPEHGLELTGALVYSQAVEASSTPGGSAPLGVELDTAVSYLSNDGFFAGATAGFLLPLGGLEWGGRDGTLGQVYRGTLGIRF